MTYTVIETAKLVNWYVNDKKTVEEIAEMVGKPTKSVIAKLSAEKVYVSKVKISKVTGAKPKTKREFVQDICEILGIDELLGLDKAPKGTLMNILEALKNE